MNRIRITLILIFLGSIATFAQDTIVSYAYWQSPFSDFEDRDLANYIYVDTTQTNNLWQIGTPSKSLFNSAHSPQLALLTDTLNTYPNATQNSFEFVIITDDFTSIDFWHRYDTDSLKDGGIVEVSTDGGLTWTNIIMDTITGFFFDNFYSANDTIASFNMQPGFTGSSSGWIKSRIMKSGGMWYYRFRFTFSSDTIDNNRDGWMIDDFDYICMGTSIEETEINAMIKLYPSPAIDQFTIDLQDGLELQNVQISNTAGQLIQQSHEQEVVTNGWPSGIYFIEISTNKGIVRKQVVKMNAR